jgi:hypothetical protein
MQTATWLVSRQLALAAGPWNVTLLGDDDGEYFCRVLLASSGVRFVPTARCYYRQVGRGSLSYVGRSNRKLEAQWRSMQLHIQYLRSLEESDRVRLACMAYLQKSLICFFPERLDIVQQMKQLSSSFGKQLTLPKQSWKYSCRILFGWRGAKRLQLAVSQVRFLIARACDKALFKLEYAFGLNKCRASCQHATECNSYSGERVQHETSQPNNLKLR